MPKTAPTRRQVLLGSMAAASALNWQRASVQGASPTPESITSQLVEAARKEGKVIWYTSVDLQVAETISKAFEAKFPGIGVRVERTGAERVFQRIGQERASNIFACDVAQSSDAAHYIAWKRDDAPHCVRARGCGQAFPSPTPGRGRHVCNLALISVRHRL